MSVIEAPTPMTVPPGLVNASVAGFCVWSSTAWPGRKSAEVLVGGCNLRCSYCFCPEMVGRPRASMCLGDAIGRMQDTRHALEGIVVTGGEPTADPALPQLLRQLSTLGLPIRVDTNGTFPEVLESVIREDLVAFVALDVKTTPERYDVVTGNGDSWDRVHRSIGLLLNSSVDHEFRTTCYPNAVRTAEIPGIARHLAGGSRYVLQQFRPQRTLDPAASGVRPNDIDALRRAALCCSVHLPTVVRGA
jgi:pyruvate formate lyase activating enzyme